LPTKGFVDADGHVRDNEASYRKYMEAPYNQRLVLATPGGGDGFDRPLLGTLGRQSVDAADWIEALDAGGVETTVLYPTAGLNVGFIKEADYAVAFCRAYNNYLSEEFLKVSPRLKGVALLPLQDVGEAVKELRRAVNELHMVGGMLPADGPFLLGKPAWDPIYTEAQRLNTMVAIHATGTLLGRGFDEYLFDRLIQAHTLSHSGAEMRQMSSIIFEAVPERFPDLRIAFLEAGCTWVPYFMDRMDEEFEFRSTEAPLLKKKPSEYVQSPNVFVACEPEERLIPETLKIVGADSIIFASDFPHWDHSFPESLFELERREDLSAAEKTQILINNPKRLYGLA
jgi:uncharacterized protein